MFGLVRAGALPAAVNWRLAAPEVTALLELMRPSAVVSDADCAGLAKQALAGFGRPSRPCSAWASQWHQASRRYRANR